MFVVVMVVIIGRGVPWILCIGQDGASVVSLRLISLTIFFPKNISHDEQFYNELYKIP